MAQPAINTKAISSVPPELWNEIAALAKEDERSVSRMVLRLLREALDARKKSKKPSRERV